MQTRSGRTYGREETPEQEVNPVYHVLQSLSPPGLNLTPHRLPDEEESDSGEMTRQVEGGEVGDVGLSSPRSASPLEGYQGGVGSQSSSVPLSPLAPVFVPGGGGEGESERESLSLSRSPSPSGGGGGGERRWSSSSSLSPLARPFNPGVDSHESMAESSRDLDGLSISESSEGESDGEGAEIAVEGGSPNRQVATTGMVGGGGRRSRRRRQKVRSIWMVKVKPEVGGLARAAVREQIKASMEEVGRRYKRSLRKAARLGLARNEGIHVEALGLIMGDGQDWDMWKVELAWQVSNFVRVKVDETMNRRLGAMFPTGLATTVRVIPWRSFAERRATETERARTLREQRDAARDESRQRGQKMLKAATWNVNGGLMGNDKKSRATQAMLRRVLSGQDVLALQETRRSRGAKRMFIPGYAVYEAQEDTRAEARGVALIVRTSLAPKLIRRTPTTVTVLISPGNGAKKVVVTCVYVSPDRRTAGVGKRNLGMAVRAGGNSRSKMRLLLGDFNMVQSKVTDAITGWEGGERLGVLPNRRPTRLGGSRPIDHVVYDGRGRVSKVDGAGATVSDHFVVYAEVEAVGWGGPGQAQVVGGQDKSDGLRVDRKLLTPEALGMLGQDAGWIEMESEIRTMMGEDGRAAWEGDVRKRWRREVTLMVEEGGCVCAYTDGSAKTWTSRDGEAKEAVGFGIHWSNDVNRRDVARPLSVDVDGGQDDGLTMDNNRAELEAVIHVLEATAQDAAVMIVSDSLLVINFLLRGFAQDKSVSPLRQNASRWQRLEDLVVGRDGLVLVAKVAAHKGVLENEVADFLAKKGAASSVDETIGTVFGTKEATNPLSKVGEYVRAVDLQAGDERLGTPGLARVQVQKLEMALRKARSVREFNRATTGLRLGRVRGLSSWPREAKEETLVLLQSEVDETYEAVMVLVTDKLKAAQLAKQASRRGSFENRRSWTQYRYLGVQTRRLIKELRDVGRALRQLDLDGVLDSEMGTEKLEERKKLGEMVAESMAEDRKKGATDDRVDGEGM